jgi:hypothetical protein
LYHPQSKYGVVSARGASSFNTAKFINQIIVFLTRIHNSARQDATIVQYFAKVLIVFVILLRTQTVGKIFMVKEGSNLFFFMLQAAHKRLYFMAHVPFCARVVAGGNILFSMRGSKSGTPCVVHLSPNVSENPAAIVGSFLIAPAFCL